MATVEATEQDIRPITETRAYLEKHMVSVDMTVASALDGQFRAGREREVMAAITREMNVAETLSGRHPHNEEYQSTLSQWRGAALLYRPDDSLGTKGEAPLLDALVYAFSALQDFRGAELIGNSRFMRSQRARRRSINPIVSEAPHNPKIDWLYKGQWKEKKPAQTVRMVDSNGKPRLLRALVGAERSGESMIRALTLFTIAVERDPNLLVQSFNLYALRYAHSRQGVEQALGILEIAGRLGQLENPRFAPLFSFVHWYVRGFRGTGESALHDYPYVANQPDTGVLYRPLEKSVAQSAPRLTRYANALRALRINQEELRNLTGAQNIVLAHLEIKDRRKVPLLKQKIASLRVELKTLQSAYRQGWNTLIRDIVSRSRLPSSVSANEYTQESMEEVESILTALFADYPDLPLKVRQIDSEYHDRPRSYRWAKESALVAMRQYMHAPTFQYEMHQVLKGNHEALFELMKYTYALILKEHYLVGEDEIRAFLLSSDKGDGKEFMRALDALTDLYPGYYVAEKSAQRMDVIREEFAREVNGDLLSRRFPVSVTRRGYREMKPGLSSDYRLERRYLPFVAAAVLVGIFAGEYLQLMQILDQWAQKVGLDQQIDKILPGPDLFGSRVQPAGGQNEGGAQQTQNESEAQPPTPDRERPRLIQYARVIREPHQKVDSFYLPIPTGLPSGYDRVDDKVMHRDNFDDIVYPSDSLVLAMRGRDAFFAPPGWEILRIYTKSDTPSVTYEDGTVVFSGDPGLVYVVYLQVDGTAPIFQAERVDQYYPINTPESFELFNSQLAADPVLQELHRAMYDALESASSAEEKSDVVLAFLPRFRSYITAYRYYALSTPNLNQQADGLVWIANNPDAGFECEVADRATREFFSSLGIVTESNVGIPLTRFRNGLWGDWGHVNSRIILPDGRIVTVDNTPPVTERTPPEDLELLKGQEPAFVDLYKEEIGRVALITGITAVSAGLLVALARMMGKRRRERREIERELIAAVKTDRRRDELPALDHSETELVLAMAYHIVTLPEEENTKEKIEDVIASLFRYRPSMRVIKGRAAFVVEMAANDETAMPFLTDEPSYVLKALSDTYGSQIPHAAMPASISDEIARYDGSHTQPSEDFRAYATLVKTMWEAMSGFSELRASVVSQVNPMPHDKRERISFAREKIALLLRETPISPENMYAFSLLRGVDAVLKVTTPRV